MLPRIIELLAGVRQSTSQKRWIFTKRAGFGFEMEVMLPHCKLVWRLVRRLRLVTPLGIQGIHVTEKLSPNTELTIGLGPTMSYASDIP